MTLDAYHAQIDLGHLHCFRCRAWHPAADFALDRSRGRGRAASCRRSISENNRARYQPRPRPEPGRRYVDARDDDVKQARRRVNYLVEAGLLPHPNTVPCTDCGHVWSVGERRHEYDHHHGYTAKHHEEVEAVCTTCHHRREDQRRAAA
jgi:hypothetical protein